MYIKRHMEAVVERLSQMFGAVLVTGSRQVGKTTMLKQVTSNIPYITLDDPIILNSAIQEPITFIKDNPPPVYIDEIQYATGMFPYIKMLIDENNGKGLFYMSGSQQFKMMQSVSETLAGRLGIVNLLGLSLREIKSVEFYEPFLPSEEYLLSRKPSIAEIGYSEVWNTIHRGCMPELSANPQYDWQLFYGAYVRTYIERDVRELTQIGDEVKFMNFMTVIASHTGQLLNLASVARDVGISEPTASRWLSILSASNIIYLLRPYHSNLIKRAVKTPKLYFLDTGLAAYLLKWNTPEVLQHGAMAGAFFETFVITEIIKSYYNAGIMDLPLYFYRDKEQNEIDLLIEKDGTLYPIEIKKHSDPTKNDIKAFRILDKINDRIRGAGGVVCLYDHLLPLQGDDRIIPINYL